MISFYNLPYCNILFPSGVCFCIIFTNWRNKHNQHFTLTHNTHTFSCSTNCYIAILLATSLCIFFISLNDIPLIVSVCYHTSSRSHTIKTYNIRVSCNISYTSYKSKTSSVPQGYVEIRTLCHVGGGNRCGRYTL
jgi:hypothetical protein